MAPTQAGTPSGHNKIGKSPPKRNAEENISPGKVKTPRRATSASATKQTAAAKKKAIPITKGPCKKHAGHEDEALRLLLLPDKRCFEE